MAEKEKVEEKVELLKLKFSKTEFTNSKGVKMPLMESYSGNGIFAADGDIFDVEAKIAETMLYNLPINFELLSKGKVADDVMVKVKAHLDNRFSRIKKAKALEKLEADKLKAQQEKNKAVHV